MFAFSYLALCKKFYVKLISVIFKNVFQVCKNMRQKINEPLSHKTDLDKTASHTLHMQGM